MSWWTILFGSGSLALWPVVVPETLAGDLVRFEQLGQSSKPIQ